MMLESHLSRNNETQKGGLDYLLFVNILGKCRGIFFLFNKKLSFYPPLFYDRMEVLYRLLLQYQVTLK